MAVTARTGHPPAMGFGRGLRVPWISERVVYGIIGFLAVLIVWETAANLGLYRRSLLSSPSVIWRAASTDVLSGTIWPHLWVSFSEFGLGLGAALLVGIPLGFAIGMFRKVDHVTSFILYGIYSTPKAAIAPLIIITVGIGLESKVVFVFLLAFFSLVMATLAGVRATSERHLDIAHSFGASRWLVFRSVVLPSTFPFILTGIRISVGRALVGVVVAEELAASEGIGHYIEFYGTFLDTGRVMLGVVILGLFGVILGEAVRRVEKRFEVWRPELH